ncbi:Homeodomain-related protein [Metarhizium album ARSEF 1941]|uniref:DNA-binding protein RAP1 n=1 Tax=Metarhizium album (strain ARSEF 1941) TaxID=1081103 RepID=A0A0B2WZT1_METAS|nr:Homeodomain-related protein [Metarhizium album ARSEF 1941]KHN99099.1 Homeodomain-related protein [Metarhizium album ARSEF 1941]
MSRSVTYNGVESATGGTIFKDMVFWVAQRVPMRNTILSHITNNDGKVVPLEKDAHILIADHARKDAPPDSYSWKYITESVEHGYAQLTDRYRIFGHPETASVHVGPSAPVKHTRTPFSAADDAALANWVLTHGQGRNGNKIFQAFAETHPWHTWQSWRSRFVKSLANLPIADLERLAMSAADLAVQATKPATRPASDQAGPKRQAEQLPKPARTPGKAPAKQVVRTSRLQAHQPTSTSPDNVQITSASAMRKERQAEKAPISSTKSGESDVDTQETMKGEFYADLLIFAEETGVEFDPDPRVGDKVVDLWDLSRAVAVQKVPLGEVDWIKVAEDLKYNWVENTGVAAELQQCYTDNLADFFEAMAGFASNLDEDVEDEQRSGPLPPESDPLSPNPPQRRNQKRSLDDHIPPGLEGSSKRRRLSRDAEIPSTPDDITGVPTTQSPSVMKAKQSRQAYSSSKKTSAPLKLPRAIEDEELDDDDEAEAQVRRIPQLDAQQSTLDVTPSQQLRSEALDVTPIPLNLGEGRGEPNEQWAGGAGSSQELEVSTSKSKATSQVSKRTLPASFMSPLKRSSPQQAEARARQPSASVREDPEEEERNSQDIRYWMEHYESLGYSRPIVIESLRRTTMTPGWPTSLLLEMLKNKQDVPSNYEGIWTDRDDQSLRYADAVKARRKSSASTRALNKAEKELDRIVHKHTQEAVDLRRRFLRAQASMRWD